MFRLVTQKIKNKLWLTICLIIGLSFLVAVCSCQPMFKNGSLNRMLMLKFENFIEDNNLYPTVLSRDKTIKYEKGKISIDYILDKVDEFCGKWDGSGLNVDSLGNQTIVSIKNATASGSDGTKGRYLDISYIDDVENHIEIVKGDKLSDEAEDGVYPFITSEKVLDDMNLVPGVTYEFPTIMDDNGNTLKLKLVGIYKANSDSDVFWYVQPNALESNILVNKTVMDKIMSDYNVSEISYVSYLMLDYRDIKNNNVDKVIAAINNIIAEDSGIKSSMEQMLSDYVSKRSSVSMMLWVLELPVLGMVLAFIYMVSGQLVESEKNEIAMFKSRGFKRTQIVMIYFVQALILSIIAIVLGISVGYILCISSASTTDFLTFGGNDTSCYSFTPQMILYGVGAAIVGIMFIVVPACLASGISIVEYMSLKNVNKKMFWEKSFLDVILLGLSLYMMYYFNQTADSIRQKAIEGQSVDPLVFLDSILFIVSFGLLVLRLTQYLVKLVYHIGRKKWKPAMYASFLQITRSFNKQGFIAVFMILTVALGIYNANGARTINRNKEERLQYEMGSDVVFKETWDKIPFRVGFATHYSYIEPDFAKYSELTNQGFAKNIAQVQKIEDTSVKTSKAKISNVMLMGINPKQFATTADLKEELNYPTHWYNYVNELSKQPEGAVISSNLANALGVEIGSSFTVYGKNKDIVDEDQHAEYKVVAIVDAWPGFVQYSYEDGEEKENYLVVTNLSSIVKAIERKPYEIWVRLDDGVSGAEFKEKLNEMGIQPEQYETLESNIHNMKTEPEIQIVNGMFTMCFLVALALCGIGFLIYWISSIRQRELLFGVYRAMGMSVSQVNKMLLNEHVFSTLFAVISGVMVGAVSTLLFSKLMAIVYLPQKHNLDIYIYFEAMDSVKLLIVVTVMIVICLIVLRKIIKSMNITQALKLGED